jgi:hypothetical protein
LSFLPEPRRGPSGVQFLLKINAAAESTNRLGTISALRGCSAQVENRKMHTDNSARYMGISTALLFSLIFVLHAVAS